MKKVYTIGEIAKMLGLGIDAIRFYEKKGLVHPTINKTNKYREYTSLNILELLDIIYYRNLEMSVNDIQAIMKTGTKESMKALLKQKKLETQNRIKYEKQLLKKLTYIETIYEKIDTQECVCSIRKIPSAFILSKRADRIDITDEFPKMSKDQYVLSSLYYTYSIALEEVTTTLITLDKDVLEQLDMELDEQNLEHIESCDCIYMVMKLDHEYITKEDIIPMIAYADEHKIHYEDVLYIREIPLTSYMDEQNYYVELYVKISQST